MDVHSITQYITDTFDQTGHDFTALDQLMPHPVYAPQGWPCVLCPSAATFEETVRPLLAEGYERAVQRQAKASQADRDAG
ncbi:MAG: hypothetical protein IT332_13200 [Ardenticatenales bacterium]|nr:hypothetical protein [Ardenticatenales bacterium]